ncbi:hypothetical protein LCGC14_1791870 [marine sediment metagenome]|uniref:Uncharacterized protein n=1 Tax=marine sediment metagenome TaxID=412755 RepID=A0A0F9J737_9ZZZZ
MEKQTNEKKRMNYYITPEVYEIFHLFHAAQDPPINKSVLHEITLTRGMFFDGDTIFELRALLETAEEFLSHKDQYLESAWDRLAKNLASRLKDFTAEMGEIK